MEHILFGQLAPVVFAQQLVARGVHQRQQLNHVLAAVANNLHGRRHTKLSCNLLDQTEHGGHRLVLVLLRGPARLAGGHQLRHLFLQLGQLALGLLKLSVIADLGAAQDELTGLLTQTRRAHANAL